jgi:hypothetical protein
LLITNGTSPPTASRGSLGRLQEHIVASRSQVLCDLMSELLVGAAMKRRHGAAEQNLAWPLSVDHRAIPGPSSVRFTAFHASSMDRPTQRHVGKCGMVDEAKLWELASDRRGHATMHFAPIPTVGHEIQIDRQYGYWCLGRLRDDR